MVEKLKNFWCAKILPLVYDDSLSYYEVLCKIVGKLNEVVEVINNYGFTLPIYSLFIGYSDTADGSNFTETPTDSTRYVGLSIGKDGVRPVNPNDYVWFLQGVEQFNGVSLNTFKANDSVISGAKGYSFIQVDVENSTLRVSTNNFLYVVGDVVSLYYNQNGNIRVLDYAPIENITVGGGFVDVKLPTLPESFITGIISSPLDNLIFCLSKSDVGEVELGTFASTFGRDNHNVGTNSFIGGGVNNKSSAINTGVVGGSNCINQGARSTILGGNKGRIKINGTNSGILGGADNVVSGTRCTINGGNKNEVGDTGGDVENSVVNGGSNNKVTSARCVINGGNKNNILGNNVTNCVINGGSTNTITGAGSGNRIDSSYNSYIQDDSKYSFITSCNGVVIEGACDKTGIICGNNVRANNVDMSVVMGVGHRVSGVSDVVVCGRYANITSNTALAYGNGNSTTPKNLFEITKGGDVLVNDVSIIPRITVVGDGVDEIPKKVGVYIIQTANNFIFTIPVVDTTTGIQLLYYQDSWNAGVLMKETTMSFGVAGGAVGQIIKIYEQL